MKHTTVTTPHDLGLAFWESKIIIELQVRRYLRDNERWWLLNDLSRLRAVSGGQMLAEDTCDVVGVA